MWIIVVDAGSLWHRMDEMFFADVLDGCKCAGLLIV